MRGQYPDERTLLQWGPQGLLRPLIWCLLSLAPWIACSDFAASDSEERVTSITPDVADGGRGITFADTAATPLDGAESTDVDPPADECSCAGAVCGDNGCGEPCGICAPGSSCVQGLCVGGCIDECVVASELQCGGQQVFVCGNFDADDCLELSAVKTCAPNEVCVDGDCSCAPSCAGKECGGDGCSGSCGTCPATSFCSDGVCEWGAKQGAQRRRIRLLARSLEVKQS